MLARVGRCPPIRPLQLLLSCAIPALRLLQSRSFLTHSSHVFLLRPLLFVPATTNPLHAETQFAMGFRSTCPNHLNRPRSTISSIPSMPNRPLSSSLDILFLRLTPHIHLTIMRSVLSNRCMSSFFIGHVSLPIHHRSLYTSLVNLPLHFQRCPP